MVLRTVTTSTGAVNASDAPGNLEIISVNGGSTLQITPQEQGILRSDGWWNAQGDRLVYRESLLGAASPPMYYVSQSDQPVGIARKLVLDASGIPALSPDGKSVAVVNPSGALLVGTPGSHGSVVAAHALVTLPGSTYPARVLWQPRHDALLYMRTAPGGIALVLHPIRASERVLLTLPQVEQAAFSPEGTQLLVQTPGHLALYNISSSTILRMSWSEPDNNALPWWSADGHSLLVQDNLGLSLVDPRNGTVTRVLQVPATATVASTSIFWTPATNNLWSPDGHHIVFAAAQGARWQGKVLAAPPAGDEGLYTVAITSSEQQVPKLIHSGRNLVPAWSTADPSTTFLVQGG